MSASALGRSLFLAGADCAAGVDGQGNRESGAYANFTLDTNLPLMERNSLLGNDQPKPGASDGIDVTAAMKRFKEVFLVRFRDADALVMHLQYKGCCSKGQGQGNRLAGR